MPPNQDFEAAFGEMVYAELRERAPKLLDHMIGFQVIDRDEDGLNGVGVAVFSVGDQMLFAPLFFSNGRLKGGELLYLKDQDLFVPLKENWINYLVNRKPQELGAMEPTRPGEPPIPGPDLTTLFSLPYSKGASWPAPGMFVSPSDARYSAIRGWIGLLEKRADLQVSLAMTMRNNIDFCNEILRWHDLNGIFTAKSAAPQSGIDEFLTLRKSAAIEESDEVPEAPDVKITGTAPKKVKVYHSPEDIVEELEDFSDDEKRDLLRGEIVVRDTRGESETSKVYKFEPEKDIVNPTGPGLYDVLLRNSEFRKLLIFFFPKTLFQGEDRTPLLMLVDPESRLALSGLPQNILTKKKYDAGEFEEEIDDLPSHESMRVDGIYMLVGPAGDSTSPFRVKQIVQDSAGLTQYEVDSCTGVDMYPFRPYSIPRPSYVSSPMRPDAVVITRRTSGGIASSGNTLFVPSNYKALKLADRTKTVDVGLGLGKKVKETRKINPPLNPGTLASLYSDVIEKGASSVTIWRDGPSVSFKERSKGVGLPVCLTMGEKQAVDRLAGMGVEGRLAVSMVRNAGASSSPDTYVIVKSAQGASPMAPPFPDMPMGYDALLGMPQSIPFETEIPAPGATYAEPVPPYAPDVLPFRRQLTDLAARTGQREVFDTAMLASLVKAVNAPALVDEYMGDLILGLDRIGRILFLLYWHPDEFAERYGREDLANLEDSLKAVFESLGDTILVLKQSVIEPETGIGDISPRLPTEALE